MKIRSLFLALLFGAASSAALAQAPAEIPVEKIMKRADFGSLAFSPDRKLLAALSPLNGRMNLAVIDLDKRNVNRLTSFTDSDVTSFFWASNDRILFTTGDQQGFEIRGDGGLFGIDVDGGNPRTLVQSIKFAGNVPRLTSIVGRIKGSKDEILVSANDRNVESQDLYRMDIRTGRKSLLSFESPGFVVNWLLDSNNVPRAAFSNEPKKKTWSFHYRSDEKSPWKTLAQWDEKLQNVVIPRGFDPGDNKKMFVVSNVGRDTLAFSRFGPEANKLGELVFADDRYDMGSFAFPQPGGPGGGGGGLIFSGSEEDPGKLLGVRYNADKPKTVWFDEDAKKLQPTLDAALPGRYNTFSPTQRRTLVASRSDTVPGEYYIFDQDKRTLEDLGIKPFSWVDPKQMAPMQPITWTSKDGMRIDGYLTLPLNWKKGSPVPLILHPHGGPWARDSWGYNPEVQFMANRGFAVLQPNFRGSTGYGTKHLLASYKQWGDLMIDDMITGIEWTIKEGYADKNRIGVYGASYGGYATLMSLVRRPDLFKWGINYVGVTDMAVHQDTQPAQRGDFGEIAKIINGDRGTDAEMFARTSPARHVSKIAAPVFHAYGGEDRNVNIENGNVIRSAFESAKKPYEWMLVPDEAHGYRVEKNVFEFYNRFDKFIKANTPK